MAERFGRYWLQEKIGQGGMAEIFRATIGPDPNTYAFHLAIKRLLPQHEQDRAQVDMFLTEADVAKFLYHPNLVRVYEAGMVDAHAYIAMEYIWGHDLEKLIGALRRKRMRFPADLAIFVTMQLVRGLDYVHRARSAGDVPMELVHRDVTPSNVYVTFGGEVKLGDFGVARVAFLESHEEGLVKGKAHYLPPEVLMGEPVMQSTDLWGAAALLYEMLTTRKPYEDTPEEELMHGAAPPAIVPVHKVNPDTDPKLAKIVMRALAARAKKRPPDAVDFYRQLKLHLRDQGIVVDGTALARFVRELVGGAPSAAQPRTTPEATDFKAPDYQVPLGMSPTQRFEMVRRRKSRRVPVVAATLAAGLILAVAAIYAYRNRAPPAPTAPAPVAEAPPASKATDVPALDFAGEFAELPEAGDESGADEGGEEAGERFRALMHRGKQQVRRGRYDSAIEAYRAALKLRPNHAAAHLGQANALLAMQRYAEAEAQVYTAIEKRPRNPPAYLLLGTILRRRGNLEQARWAYQQCIDIDPESRAALTAREALAQF